MNLGNLMGDGPFSSLLSKQSPEDKLRGLCVPWGWGIRGQKKSDHGERTNRKLNDQPFYHRDHDGKMQRF